MARPRRIVTAALGLFCTSTQLFAGVAHAQDASAAETGAARALAVDGLKLAQAGNCVEALPKLERAEKLYHSAVVASRMGECYVSVGRLVEGSEVLRKVLREPQPADSAPALIKALERAQRTLDAAKPRIAGITIRVAAVEGLSVKVDGQLVPAALLDTEIPMDPGEHGVEVSAPKFLKAATRLRVSDGEKKMVTLTLTRDPSAPAAPAATVASETASSDSPVPKPHSTPPIREDVPAPPPRAPNHTAAFVSLGVGAVGVGLGGVLGVMAMKQRQELESRCPKDVCPPDQRDALDGAKRIGNFSSIAFGVGGASLVLGTVLFFSAGSSSADRALGQRRTKVAGLSNPRAAIGPGEIQFGADF